MASSVEVFPQPRSNDTNPSEDVEDQEDDEYFTASEDFEDSKVKSCKSCNIDATQGAKARPAQDSQSKPVQFTLFKRLPQETQDAIWKFAIEAIEPRVVEIWEGYRKESPDGEYPWPWTGEFTSSCPIPGVLHACCDSQRLALKRWKLCFAFERQPAKIFFDLNSDILYFGRAFDCIHTFREKSKKADRRAVHKIAFHLLQQWHSEYYETSGDLAIRLHRDFHALDEVVFVEKDVEYDWDRHEMGRAQKRPNPKKTVITFRPPNEDPRPEDRTANDLVATYAVKKWVCLKVDHMDYERSRPHNPDRPVKPSEDASEEDWDEYFMKMEYTGEEPSCDEPFSDDDEDSEWGGWLDEVPDLQMRVMLATNPDLRPHFGF
jgi:2EXR family